MPGESVITQEMLDAIGVESEPITHEVEGGAIVRFAQAIGDLNPVFNDEEAARKTRYGGLIAPPTFLDSLLSAPAGAEFPNPYPASLEGGSEWRDFEPVRPGDRITVNAKISDIFARKGRLGDMLLVVREFRYVNQFDQVAALRRRTAIYYQPPEGRP